jgi:hypothetical protein
MYGRRLFGIGVIAMLVIGLLTISITGAYRSGWSNGFISGSIAASSEDGVAIPAGGYGYGHGYGAVGFFSGVGLLFRLGLFFLFFMFMAKLVGFWLWRMAGRPGSRHWGWHRQKHRWWQDEDEAKGDEAYI